MQLPFLLFLNCKFWHIGVFLRKQHDSEVVLNDFHFVGSILALFKFLKTAPGTSSFFLKPITNFLFFNDVAASMS